jgi:hypothetical protein
VSKGDQTLLVSSYAVRPTPGVVVGINGNAKIVWPGLRANPLSLVHFDPGISDKEGLVSGDFQDEGSPIDH